MPIVHVPHMISTLGGIPGAIEPTPPLPLRPVDQFERKRIYTPGGVDSVAENFDEPAPEGLDGDLIWSLSDAELGEAVRKAGTTPGPWGDPREGGTDALAWYVSFHRDTQGWGIYIPVTGLLKFAHFLAPSGPGSRSWESVVRLAMRGLLAHERMHYGVDYAAGQIELLFNAACYLVAHKALSNGRYVPDEEQLANGACLRSIKYLGPRMGVPGVFAAAVAFTKTQPPGYRDGDQCIETSALLGFANDYVRSVAAHIPAPTTPKAGHPIDYTKFLPLGPLTDVRGRASNLATIDGRQCPIYLILDGATIGLPASALQYIDVIPSIVNSPRFDKQLRKLGMEQDWEDVKSALSTPRALRTKLKFKRWPPEDGHGVTAFSVRVGKGNTNIRAHLHLHAQNGTWLAASIWDGDRQGHH